MMLQWENKAKFTLPLKQSSQTLRRVRAQDLAYPQQLREAQGMCCTSAPARGQTSSSQCSSTWSGLQRAKQEAQLFLPSTYYLYIL